MRPTSPTAGFPRSQPNQPSHAFVHLLFACVALGAVSCQPHGTQEQRGSQQKRRGEPCPGWVRGTTPLDWPLQPQCLWQSAKHHWGSKPGRRCAGFCPRAPSNLGAAPPLAACPPTPGNPAMPFATVPVEESRDTRHARQTSCTEIAPAHKKSTPCTQPCCQPTRRPPDRHTCAAHPKGLCARRWEAP